MVTIGVDAHKRTHTFVAVDDVGKKVSERTVTATSEGHLDASSGPCGGPTGAGRSKTAVI